MPLEVIPAILVKDRGELLRRIAAVSPHVKTVHIDVMDNRFVPNRTVGLESFSDLPSSVHYEFHWMVEHPESYIAGLPGPYLHIVHCEAVKDWGVVEEAVRRAGGALGIAFNPATPTGKIIGLASKTKRILAMTVVPGFDGQKYMAEVELKISELRARFPAMEIEVDGGINPETAARAVKAGADKLAASSAIFTKDDKKLAIAMILRSCGVLECRTGSG
jgi:ribulose-phosphate 3-epimerase